MSEKPSKAMPKFRMVNVEGTLNLARQAVKAGVKRFIFISSIKVNGIELTIGSRAFLEHDVPNPLDPYALSKYEAERGLLEIANSSNMEVVIIRPPLVYGRGVKGNFATMIKAVKFGLPLPFGLVNNVRSFVALDNLVDLIINCIDHPKRKSDILVSDGRDISIADLVKKISDAYGVKNKKFPIPVSLMKFALKLIRRGVVADRLFGNLLVDSSKAEKLLNWKPVLSMDEQLKIMADYDNFDRYK